ncbi:heme peroxidase, partial [Mycena albidolilacea]
PKGSSIRSKYAYRQPDGSNYVVPLSSTLGKANSSYVHSVPTSSLAPHATLPDAGLLFDNLLARDRFVPHPGGLNSLFYAFANLIIHSVFHTSHWDHRFNSTSSYLDLSILYGNSEKDMNEVRNKDGYGRLHEDVFADSRLLFMPPSSCALLVLLCRNHNFTAKKILEINEQGTYKAQFESDAEKLAQDDEIFNRTRLVNCGYFMQIVLCDYVGAILGLARDGCSWRLDPISQFPEAKEELSPRGNGCAASIEFNLMYRWHATLSEEETRWTEWQSSTVWAGLDLSTITPQEFDTAPRPGLAVDPDVKNWTFSGRVIRTFYD